MKETEEHPHEKLPWSTTPFLRLLLLDSFDFQIHALLESSVVDDKDSPRQGILKMAPSPVGTQTPLLAIVLY